MSKTNVEHYYKDNSKTLRYAEELFQSGFNQLERQCNAWKVQRFNELVEENKKLREKYVNDVCNEKSNKIDNLMPKHLSSKFIQQLDKCMTNQDIKCIAHKINEIVNYLQHISKV